MDFAASVSSWAAPVCWEVNVANGEADAFPNQLFLLLCGSLGGEGAYIALSHEHVHRHCYKPSNYKSEPCVYLKDEVSILQKATAAGKHIRNGEQVPLCCTAEVGSIVNR